MKSRRWFIDNRERELKKLAFSINNDVGGRERSTGMRDCHTHHFIHEDQHMFLEC